MTAAPACMHWVSCANPKHAPEIAVTMETKTGKDAQRKLEIRYTDDTATERCGKPFVSSSGVRAEEELLVWCRDVPFDSPALAAAWIRQMMSD